MILKMKKSKAVKMIERGKIVHFILIYSLLYTFYKEVYNMELKPILDSFMNDKFNSFMDQLEILIEKNLSNREDYYNIEKSINEIEAKYPKARQYLEDNKIADMSDNEKEAVLNIIELYRDIKTIELKETFKLGGKEMYIFLKEMNMLKY